MKKKYYLLLLLILFPIKASAVYDVIDSRCTNDLKVSLREEAKEVTYRLSKTTTNNNVTYSLIFYNVSDNLYITDSSSNKYDDKIDNLKPGTNLTINIYASNKNYCEGYKAGSRIISVPYYNKYSESELCTGYETYALCKEDANINITEEEFTTRMNEYINSLKNNNDDIIEENIENNFNILDFIEEYGIYILGLIAIIIVIVVAAIIENKRKNKTIL